MLCDGEPAAGPWHVEPVEEFARQLLGSAGSPAGRPAVVAVDGRSGSGKTTVSERICAEELPFLVQERPWERAAFIVAGTPLLPHDPARQVVIAGPVRGPGLSRSSS